MIKTIPAAFGIKGISMTEASVNGSHGLDVINGQTFKVTDAKGARNIPFSKSGTLNIGPDIVMLSAKNANMGMAMLLAAAISLFIGIIGGLMMGVDSRATKYSNIWLMMRLGNMLIVTGVAFAIIGSILQVAFKKQLDIVSVTDRTAADYDIYTNILSLVLDDGRTLRVEIDRQHTPGHFIEHCQACFKGRMKAA